MGVNLTETAALHVTRYLEERGSGIGIRLAVKTTGCSGLMYVLEPVDEPQPEDLRFDDQAIGQVRVAVEKLRELSPLWDMYKDGVDMDKIEWAVH